MKDKKWVSGDTVGLTVATRRSCTVNTECRFNCDSSHSSHMHMVHAQLTHVDFSFYEILDKHRVFEPALLEGYPVLKVSLSLVLSV